MAKYKDFDDDYIYDDEDDGYYDDSPIEYESPKKNKSSSKGSSSRPKKRMKRWARVLICSVEIIILVALGVVLYAVNKLGKIQINPLNPNDIVINQDINNDTKETLSGYTNILLMGVDGRDNTPGALTKKEENHADTIMIASINNKTKEVRLVSVYRDTFLEIPKCNGTGDSTYSKATESMFFYGVESTMSMLNKNLDLDISDYVIVNWKALIDIVDAVGGIDLEINDVELEWLNKYLVDTSVNTGVSYTEVPHSGYVHLNGIQATAFCRIRYGGGSDYRRTERQRTVIQLVIDKAKHMNITELNNAANAIFNNVATSIQLSDLLSMAKNLNDYNITETSGYPFEVEEGVGQVPGYPATSVLMTKGFVANVSELHAYLFDVKDYDPSETVKGIANYLFNLTGVE